MSTTDYLEVEVSDRTPGVKQKARFSSLLAEQLPDGMQVTIRVQVNLYAATEAGGYGAPLSGKGLSSWSVPLVANNSCAVNRLTGEVVLMQQNEERADWLALVAAEPGWALQGDWFKDLMDNKSVEITPMLRRFIQQADQPPFSKFA